MTDYIHTERTIRQACIDIGIAEPSIRSDDDYSIASFVSADGKQFEVVVPHGTPAHSVKITILSTMGTV